MPVNAPRMTGVVFLSITTVDRRIFISDPEGRPDRWRQQPRDSKLQER